ncbi:hypothetical protein [Acinetobacter brisouii]|uniref:hypothetical protein n=1 Tax=Acinetobacter brisouii TaxID=396323 RepID=UPI00148F0B79|nr:hypothetical protein [Acinetobacter brisouii]
MRNKQILIRLSDAEHRQLAELCQQLDLNQSEVIRYSQIIIKPIQWCNELFRTF